MLRFCSLLVLVVMITPLSVLAAPHAISGSARVIDGDTIELAGERIRLFAIDAPELHQTCSRQGRNWPCGIWARDQLRLRLARQQVTCTGQDHDRYGRLLAICRTDAGDIGQALVRDGVAFAYARYSTAYVAQEKAAMQAHIGLWDGTAARPETVRHAATAPATTLAASCAIKGNISSSGHIYHVPGQRDYAATRISAAKGERWFCSAQDAEAAGWRAARR